MVNAIICALHFPERQTYGALILIQISSLPFMLNFMTTYSITLSVILLLHNVIPSRSHLYTQLIGMFFYISKAF